MSAHSKEERSHLYSCKTVEEEELCDVGWDPTIQVTETATTNVFTPTEPRASIECARFQDQEKKEYFEYAAEVPSGQIAPPKGQRTLAANVSAQDKLLTIDSTTPAPSIPPELRDESPMIPPGPSPITFSKHHEKEVLVIFQ